MYDNIQYKEKINMNSLNIKFLNNLSKDSYINYNRPISFLHLIQLIIYYILFIQKKISQLLL